MYDHTTDKTRCREISFVIDEAGITPIPELFKHIATVRSRKMSFLLAYQNVSQLDIYGESNARTILGNMRTQLFSRQSDLKTAQFLQERLDYTSGFARSEHGREGKDANTGKSEQRIPLLSIQYLMDLMPDDEIIGFYQDEKGMPPFKEKRLDWHDFPELVRRAKMIPPAIPVLPPSGASFQSPAGRGPSTKLKLTPLALPVDEDSSWRLKFSSKRE